MKNDLTGQKVGEFVLLGHLASGGSGDVYRSIQPGLLRPVAIKILRDDDARPGGRDQLRFRREAILSSWIGHPLATQVFAYGQHGDRYWIAMELVDGQNLRDWMIAHGPIALDKLIPMLEPLVEVLAHLHAQGIIHRDLKPSNLMVTTVGGRTVLRLLDLGIAKVPPDLVAALRPRGATEPGELAPGSGAPAGDVTNREVTNADVLTASNVGMGSLLFMPPEQWANANAVGPESDIYALGVVVFNALIGHAPFNAESSAELRRLHERQPVPSVGGELARDLDPILRRALAKQPQDRYHSAPELVSELRRALRANEARKATRLRRLFTGLVATLAVAVVAVAVLGVSRYQAAREIRAAQRVTEAVRTQSQVDQGRSALLFGQPNAVDYLTDAYQRGDHSAGTKFMLDRALQSTSTVAQLQASSGRQWSAKYSPDGTKIVTTDDRAAQIWDAATYKRLLLLPHGAEVYDAFFSADSKRLITVAQSAVRVWDTTKGDLVHELKPEPGSKPADYFIAATSSDGNLVAATNMGDGVTHVWDTVSGRLLAELPSTMTRFYSLAFSSDSRWLAASGGDDISVFDTAIWKPTVIREPGIRALAFAPDKPLLLTGTTAGDVSIWNVPNGARAQHFNGHGASIFAIAWAPNGEFIAAGSGKGAVEIWRSDSDKWVSELNLRASRILSLEFDPTSKLVLASTLDGAAVVGDVSGASIAVFDGPKSRVPTAHFDTRSRHVLGAAWDGTARIWDMASSYRRWTSPRIDDDCRVVTSDTTHPVIAVACKDHPTRVWDVSADRLLATLPSVSEIDRTLIAPAVSHAQDRVAIAHGTTVDVYELPSGRITRTISHAAQVSALAFSSSEEDIITGTLDGSVRLTRANGATVEFPSALGGIDSVGSLPDGRVLASDTKRRLRSYDRAGTIVGDVELAARGSLVIDEATAEAIAVPNIDFGTTAPLLVDLTSYQIIALDEHKGPVINAQWIDGDQILTAGSDGKVCRWTPRGQLIQCYYGEPLVAAGTTPDGIVVAGDVGGRLWFWDRDTGGQLWKLQTQGHQTAVVAIHIEIDGESIVTFGLDGEISRWKLPKFQDIAPHVTTRPGALSSFK